MATQTQVTQLNNLIDLRVTSNEMENAITASEQGILAQTVQNGEVIAQINQEAGTTLIQNDKLYLDVQTVAFSGNAFIPSAAIEELNADKITTGTLFGNDVTASGINANTIVGNTTEFVQSAWNSAVGGNVSIAGNGVRTTDIHGIPLIT